MPTADGDTVEEPTARIPTWLSELTLALALGVVVLGAYLLRELTSDPKVPARPAGISASAATEIIDRELGAIRSFLPDVYGPLHAPDVTFIDRVAGERLQGVEELHDALAREVVNFARSPVRTTHVEMATESVAIYGTTWGLGTDGQRRGAGIVIVTFENGKIAREVVVPMGGVRATDDLLP